MNSSLAVYQGEFNQLEAIKVPALSRAYTFSDSVYEVIPYFSGRPLSFMRHIERFKNSASLLSIAANFSLIESEVSRLAESLEGQDGYVYFQLSRGVDIMRSHMHKDDLEPERFGYALPLDFSASSLDILDAKLCDDIRWSNCHIKSTSLLGNTMQMNSARACLLYTSPSPRDS